MSSSTGASANVPPAVAAGAETAGAAALLPMAWLFETARLRCRRLLAEDLAELLAVYGDAEAMRYVGDGLALSEAQCRAWLLRTEQNYQLRGYGMAALLARDGGALLGFCGLVHPGGQPQAEIKYAFKRSCWGQGLASEAARGLLDYGGRVLGLGEIIATVDPEHLASQRVLVKAGMRRGVLRDNGDGSHTQLFHWSAGPAR